jgi:putative membrane protein
MGTLFSSDDKSRIAAAVTGAESRTEGELVVVVAKRSDDYAQRRALFAVAFMVLSGYALLLAWPELPARILLLLSGVAALAGYALTASPPLLRLVVPRSVRAFRVDARAKRLFVEEGVMETRERSGVLLYLSEIEHRVEILADAGIHARVEEGFWEHEVAAIVDAIRRRDATEGLLASIERIGARLAEAFPRTTPRENQLDDAIRER